MPSPYNTAGYTMDDRAIFEVVWDRNGNYLKVVEGKEDEPCVLLIQENKERLPVLGINEIEKLIETLTEARRYLNDH